MRKYKTIMELIFIFILPLIFLLTCITINKEYVYDNNGNYETNEINIQFDNTIIKYSKQKTTSNITHNNFEVQIRTQLYGEIYIPTTYTNTRLFYGETPKEGECVININNGILTFNIMENITSYNYSSIINSNNINYYMFEIDNHDDLYLYPYDEIYEDLGYETITQTTTTENTIWGNIKQLLIDNLDLNNTIIIDIIISYTMLWFIMFVIWHLFYLFFDMLIHLFIDWGHKEKEKING